MANPIFNLGTPQLDNDGETLSQAFVKLNMADNLPLSLQNLIMRYVAEAKKQSSTPEWVSPTLVQFADTTHITNLSATVTYTGTDVTKIETAATFRSADSIIITEDITYLPFVKVDRSISLS